MRLLLPLFLLFLTACASGPTPSTPQMPESGPTFYGRLSTSVDSVWGH